LKKNKISIIKELETTKTIEFLISSTKSSTDKFPPKKFKVDREKVSKKFSKVNT
jgi:hypothetical protein